MKINALLLPVILTLAGSLCAPAHDIGGAHDDARFSAQPPKEMLEILRSGKGIPAADSDAVRALAARYLSRRSNRPVSADVTASPRAAAPQWEFVTTPFIPLDATMGDAFTLTSYTAPAGNGALMAASFAPFKPKVRYCWDGTYFYAESDGMPDRTRMPNLMVGITSWQQQVPIPTSFFSSTVNSTNDTGSLGYQQPNHWRLPLVPVPSASPIPISSGNFQRGAIALAADGIPIFNPANNTGRISYEIGELDAYGGHCGLGDDYHYHIAPVHLTPVLGNDKPIAWSLDGYAMYGYVEPDGSPMQALDADGGHDIGNGWGYHYHARGTYNAGTGQWTPGAPYMNAAFHGTVVNYGGQVDPQPTGSGLRASGTGGYTAQPVAGASIIAFKNPVALSVDGSGHFIENTGGTPSNDDWLMRISVSGTSYDICWRLNRTANPRTMTITWRLPGATTTTTYNNSGSRITAYPMAAASQAKIPDTSQTLDATPTFGEDADYTIHPQSFTDNGNGTITDSVTGLMWQKVDNGESTWETAVANAAGITTGGYNDWRLPTPSELFSILNHNNGNPAAIDTTYFPNNPGGTAGYWWTGDLYGSSTVNVWCANAGGGLGPKPKTETISAGGTLRYHARYVRGAKPTNGHNYLNNGDGTITDLDTGLMWSQVPGAAVTWEGALTYAENLTLGGYTDWRLPNIKELQTLTDYALATATSTTGIKPSINRTLFPAATATAYWSSTTVKGATTTEAWLVEAGINSSSNPQRNSQGIISYELKTVTHPVFAVRTTSVTTQIAVEQPSGTALTDGVSTVTYGNVNVGSTSSKTFVIRNTGDTSLAITGTGIDGVNADLFTVTTPPAASIAAGASTTMVVQFNAATAGGKAAALHIASSDTAVGAAFDITLSGTGFIPPPAITNVTSNPAVPGNTDTPAITATIAPATGATISSVQLTYNTGAQVTGTVFNETMSSTATGGTGGWDGTGAAYPWTLVFNGGAGNIKQTTAANHTTAGQGGTCGLEFGKGSATNSPPNSATTTNPINTSGASGYVEFYVATSNVAAGQGWNFLLAADGANFGTARISELTGSVHGFTKYHYDLLSADLLSTQTKMRFEFLGNNTGGAGGSKVQIDDITVVTTTGAPPVTLAMTGPANGGTYALQLPAQVSGTTVSYTITATDSNGSATNAAGAYTTGPAPGITTGATLPSVATGGAYSQVLAASGGTGPTYTWSVNAGSSLPSGLTLSSAGVLSGTVVAAGNYGFTLKVTDSAGRIATKAFTLNVTTQTAPNVVIILTDDQGWGDISYHTASGQVPVQTPNMERIGTEGIRLEKFYATPVCAVTRACLLTGRNTLRTNAGNQKGLGLPEHLMPQTFKAAGYQTFMCGKWHLGGTANNINTATVNGSTFPVIQEGAQYLPHNRGWDLHYGQYGGAIGYFSHASVDPGIAGTLDWWLNGTPVVETADMQGNGGYSTDLLADKAVSQIVNRDKAKPMLLYLAFNGVHAGVQAPQSYISKYAALGVTNTARRTICAALDCMDVAIGRVLAALDSEGITGNTLVIFMSDNGGEISAGSINSPLRGDKGDSYDAGIHTPAAIRWPGVLPAGVVSNQYVWIGDIFPTICAATGVTPQNTKPFDGINLWPALLAASNSTVVARPVPLVTCTSTPVALHTFTDPVNGGSKVFKLIRTPGTSVTNQLFNMTDDPYETTDLLLGANAAAYASIVTSLTSTITGIVVENYPPYIGDAPKPPSVAQDGSITLYAPFTSYKTPVVQWRRNGANLTGATGFANVTSSGTAVNGVYLATLTLPNVNGTHAGSYDVVVTNVGGTTVSQAGTLTITRPFSTLNDGLPDSWKLANGVDPSSTAAINGPFGDLEQDGRINFLEYAFNENPRTFETDPFHAAVVTKAGDGLNYLEFSYRRRIGAVDLSYTVEISEDLAAWSSPEAAFEPVSTVPNADGITETVTVRVLPAITLGARKFARLRVTSQ
jgi:arylsulfatase A-like enzyme